MSGVTSLAGERLRQRFIEAVVEEGERFGVLVAELAAGPAPAGGLDVPVPWIPGWTARDLVGHLGTVHRWATAIVRAGTGTQLLLHLWGRPADVRIEGDAAAEALLRGR